MSDVHSRLSRDLAEYKPNWPLPKKARVYKDTTFFGGPCWRWEHACAYRGGALNYSYPQTTHAQALESALKHLEGCL